MVNMNYLLFVFFKFVAELLVYLTSYSYT